MNDLQDFQFELDGYRFGLWQPISCDQEGFDPGTAEWVTQDAESPTGDARAFGRDRLMGPTWGFDLFVDARDTETALEAYGGVAAAWRNEDKRRDPGSVCTLRYAVAGRTRRVYGRPRRFAGKPNNAILQGTMPVTTDFTTVDPWHYDDDEQRVVIPIVPNTAGGLTAPLTAPLMAVGGGGPRAGQVVVGGDSPAPVIIEVAGPVTSPWVAGDRWELSFPGLTVAYDQTLVVDTRPWMLTAKIGNTFVSGQRSRRSSFFDECRLQPGEESITFSGVDLTGTAVCTVRFRNTWASL